MNISTEKTVKLGKLKTILLKISVEVQVAEQVSSRLLRSGLYATTQVGRKIIPLKTTMQLSKKDEVGVRDSAITFFL